MMEFTTGCIFNLTCRSVSVLFQENARLETIHFALPSSWFLLHRHCTITQIRLYVPVSSSSRIVQFSFLFESKLTSLGPLPCKSCFKRHWTLNPKPCMSWPQTNRV